VFRGPTVGLYVKLTHSPTVTYMFNHKSKVQNLGAYSADSKLHFL